MCLANEKQDKELNQIGQGSFPLWERNPVFKIRVTTVSVNVCFYQLNSMFHT